jgi:hypothetical protein
MIREPIENIRNLGFDGDEVAPGRFELPSLPPEGGMIDRYTTGL